LENNLKSSPSLSQLLPIHFQKVFALKLNFPFGRLNQSQKAASHRGFPASAFAYQPQGFSLLQSKAHPIDRLNSSHGPRKDSLPSRKVFLEVADLEKRNVHSISYDNPLGVFIGAAVLQCCSAAALELTATRQNSITAAQK
jgi:hypothetical protein